MNFVLLKIFTNEMEMNLAKGKLESQDIQTKFANSGSGPTKFSRPNEFGIYVSEDQLEKAQSILATMIAFPNSHNPSVFVTWKTSIIVLIVAILLTAYYLSQHNF